MVEDLHYLELTELAKLLHTRQLSPVEVVDAQLTRIAALDPKLRSYARVFDGLAPSRRATRKRRLRAARSKARCMECPSRSKNFAGLKANQPVREPPSTESFDPPQHATVVRKLREAGAVLLGKLGQTEGAFAEHHPDIPAPLNPWNHDHWVGSSSSGSGVATASGLCYGSLGTDTGGSIRFPSAANNVTGIKPTWGRVSRFGVFELAATLDHIGPMTRSAADAAAMLGVNAGGDELDPTASLAPVGDYVGAAARGRNGLNGYRVAIDPRWNTEGVDEPTRKAMDRVVETLRDLGVQLTEVTFPYAEHIVASLPTGFPIARLKRRWLMKLTYPARKNEYGPGLAQFIESGRSQSAMDYKKMILRHQDFHGRVRPLFQRIDLLVIPSAAIASPTNARLANLGSDAALLAAMLRFTCTFDMARNPTITLPGGFTEQRTPIGFQFVAGHLNEEALCAAGTSYQSATDWHRQHPFA